MVIRWAASNQPRGEHNGGVESQVAKRPVYAYAHAKDLQPRRKGGAAISMDAARAGKNSPRRRLKASSLTALSPMPLKNSAVRVSARYAEPPMRHQVRDTRFANVMPPFSDENETKTIRRSRG